MKHIVLFITYYFVSTFNKDSLLLTNLMIKDMIKSLTYSISLEGSEVRVCVCVCVCSNTHVFGGLGEEVCLSDE
jgi:hypothetical protein